MIRPSSPLTMLLSRHTRRREFITLVGGAVAFPVAVTAEPATIPVIGFLSARSPDESAQHVAAFRRGLGEAGYFEDRNVAIEYRWAGGHYDRLPLLASDLAKRGVAVIAAIADPSPQVAKAATQTIPIVFAINGDPVRTGLVGSLNRPGENATGITIFGPAAVTKRVQLLHELAPHAEAVTYVVNPNNPHGDVELSAARAALTSLGKEMLVLSAGSELELDAAFADADRQRLGALLVASDPFFVTRRDHLVSLVARRQIPAMYYLREFVEAGGLMAYGNRLADVYRLIRPAAA